MSTRTATVLGLALACVLAAALRVAPPAAAGTPFLGNAGPPAYAAFLEAYVDSTAPGETRFDYAALAAAPDRDETLRALRESFLAVDPEALGPKVKVAWAVNAYNFLIVDYLIDRWLARDGKVTSIMDGGEDVFSKERFPLGESSYSFDALEHTFLFEGEHPDPRLHFAIVCGARGCPPLQPMPLRAQDLDADLDRAVRTALQSPHQVRIDGSQVHLSKLFEWYAPHFAAYPGGARGFLADHGVPIPEHPVLITDIPWDWDLNKP